MRIASKTSAPGKVDTSIGAYVAKRDFSRSPEPQPASGVDRAGSLFVVQKHRALRAGLHYDFRLQHNGVLLSWAVPKGPSLDPSHKRMAVHVEDHPIDYADFAGEIAQGYGAGAVEIWDRGIWHPLGDPDEGMHKGHLRFTLEGRRLRGEFSLVRMQPRGRSKQEAWLLVKSPDETARAGGDAERLEAVPIARTEPPAPLAVRQALPAAQKPELCETETRPPAGEDWLSEVKFDGYRLIVRIDGGNIKLFTREGHDWTARMGRLARAFTSLSATTAMLDGELVVLRDNGISDFGGLQNALSTGRDGDLMFYAFDLLHLDGWDLRSCRLDDRKRLLRDLSDWSGRIRYSDHHEGSASAFLRLAAEGGLEGIVMKRRDAPYRAGRHSDWVKVKILGRAEFVIIGWTPPSRSRVGFGALQIGYFDDDGRLHYAGGVGTGFSDAMLVALRAKLDALALPAAPDLISQGEKPPRNVRWVRPELVAEINFTDWSNDGRLRHAVFLGLREDKRPTDVKRDRPARTEAAPAPPPAPPPRSSKVVVTHAPKHAGTDIAGVHISHADREIWPGFSKLALAEYWQAMAEIALPGIARRPLAILRCPEGIDGEQFFQKHRGGFMPEPIREGSAEGQPYLAIDDVAGLIAMAQMSAVELHCWGATEDDPAHPDRMVFDLDPGEGVAWPEVVKAAHDLRSRLAALELESFCRTSGGKGLHVVVPLSAEADWGMVKPFCRAFAEQLSTEEPKRFLAHTKIADRQGRILIDWLRNGPGATAIASFSPRARPGATVATPLSWNEVTDRLAPSSFTIASIPQRIAKQKADPWAAFSTTRQTLPKLPAPAAKAAAPKAAPVGKSRIVVASKPKRKS
jgi:bifunctional non-homologous end joining protein LigD